MDTSDQHIAVVTSCSREGWDKYGRTCVESLLKFWPTSVPIQLVSEDELPYQELSSDRITFWPLLSEQRVIEFYERHKNNARYKGLQSRRGVRDFRMDGYTFSKKVFAIEIAARAHPSGRLFWLDADTVTHKPVPELLLKSLLPPEAMLSYIDRNNYHSETSFIGFNLNHPTTFAFIQKFSDLYASDTVWTLKEWHDAWVFDWLRKSSGLQAHVQFKIPHTNNSHPFVHSILGEYMDHLKGRRKDLVMSPEHPLARKKR